MAERNDLNEWLFADHDACGVRARVAVQAFEDESEVQNPFTVRVDFVGAFEVGILFHCLVERHFRIFGNHF